ncbi:MAG: lactoylglutathione lyase [Lachnospiraceae bacterium]|jgi:methylmalonyl-CoA/ethylmalonyl-CoA epimerase|nr:lactoylglutathione lyase [Lachnospiraceae bacterium]
MKVHHIGYFVKNIEKGKRSFIDLGYEVEQDVVRDEYRGIDIAFLVKDGYRVELVSPYTEESVVYDLRKRMGNSPYHICYEVADLDTAIGKLQAQRFVVTQEPHEAVAIDGKRVCFLIHGQIGIIELVEES